jgi:uncharacterized membrane protein YqgA involved in biofilm formation
VFRGFGTVLNVAAVLAGSGLGLILGGRLPERTRSVITHGLGLVVLLIGGLDAASVVAPRFARAVGAHAPVLIVLGSVLLGGVAGSLLRLTDRVESLGALLQRRLSRGGGTGERGRAVEAFVVASMVFCVGPLAVLGALQDGIGAGFNQLAVKSILDGFASMAFASTLGWGVALSSVTVLLWQGSLTAIGFGAGSLLSPAEVDALTAAGGVLLAGVALRLLDVQRVAVVDLLPALAVAPAITAVVATLH